MCLKVIRKLGKNKKAVWVVQGERQEKKLLLSRVPTEKGELDF